MSRLFFYTSEKLLFRYGFSARWEIIGEFMRANLVFPMEPSRLINLDEILRNILCFKPIALNIEIENDELLTFGIYYSDRSIQYLKKLLSGEIRFKSRYCPEIFFYKEAGDNDNPYDRLYDLVVYEENNDRLYVLPRTENQNNHRIGWIFKERGKFLKKITSPNFNNKVIDVSCSFESHSQI